MDLLEKFGTVAVEVVNRISPADKDFCEKHQAAYETAKQAFQELAFFWEDMISAQKELLGGCSENTNHYMLYLSSKGRGSINLSAENIESHIKSLHSTFISTIVHYFNSAYNVTVPCETVEANLLPGEPDFYNKEAWQAYHEQMQALTVRYQDVVEQIILRLDGRNFAEQAFYELAKKCHNAAWNTYQEKAEYERNKNVIRFSGYKCRCSTRYDGEEWMLQDDMKNILTGAAHFETGSYQLFPVGFSELLGWRGASVSVHEFPTCEKVLQLKMFKNGRVDLKFASETLVEEFTNKYLGAVC